MENQLSSFPLSILVCSLLFLIIIIKAISSAPARSKNLPPGPRKLPILGNLHQLVTSQLPHQKFRELSQKYGPLMHLQLGEIPTVVVSSPEFAKEVLKTHDILFASRPSSQMATVLFYNASDIVFSPYGDYWRQLRKICVLELLSMKRVMSFRSVREKEVMNLVDCVETRVGSAFNFTERVSLLTYKITCMAAFGEIGDYYESFRAVLDGIVRISNSFNLNDLFPSVGGLVECFTGEKRQMLKLHKEVDRIFEGIFGEHKKRGGGVSDGRNEDLVDVLLKVQGGGQFDLSMDNIKAVLFDIFAAGTETSSMTMHWTMLELMKNPEVMQKVQAEVREVFNRIGSTDETGINEMKFLKLVIKETLRLHPPVPMLPARESREECEIKGYKIPKKTWVLVNAYAIGRDPNTWSELTNLFQKDLLICRLIIKEMILNLFHLPGMFFGIATVELPLAMLLYHFDWKLPDGVKPEDLDGSEAIGMSSRKKEDLLIIPVKKQV